MADDCELAPHRCVVILQLNVMPQLRFVTPQLCWDGSALCGACISTIGNYDGCGPWHGGAQTKAEDVCTARGVAALEGGRHLPRPA